MEPNEAVDLVKRITTRMKEIGRFVDESVKRAYIQALTEHDVDIATPIVTRMLESEREPWTSTELARVIYKSTNRAVSGERQPPPPPEEQMRRMHEGLLKFASDEPDSWFARHVREKWADKEAAGAGR